MQPILQAQQQALQAQQQQTTAALQALQAQQQAQQQTSAALQALQAAVLRSEVNAAKAYNSGCRDARPFMPVPNNAGATAPVGCAPLPSFADIRALNGQELLAWCAHFGVPATAATLLLERRQRLAAALGTVPLQGDLE